MRKKQVQELVILVLLSNIHSPSVPELCRSYCFLLAKSRLAWVLSVSLKSGFKVHKSAHLTVTSFIMIQWQSKATKLVSTTWNREQTSYQSACLWKTKKKLNGCSLQMTKTEANALEDLCYSAEDREPLAKFCRSTCVIVWLLFKLGKYISLPASQKRICFSWLRRKWNNFCLNILCWKGVTERKAENEYQVTLVRFL